MPHANGRIRTTHAGSLPRPDDLADMIWARMDGEAVDEAQLEQRIDSAVREVAARDVPLADIIGEVLGRPLRFAWRSGHSSSLAS